MPIARQFSMLRAPVFATILLAAALLSGCGTAAILDRDARDPGEGESIVVFKASPARFRLHFFAGEIKDGKFDRDGFGAKINGLPHDGYIVAKVDAGQILGLTTVVETKESLPSGLGGKMFSACGGASVLVFEVPRSKVVYLTDIEYEHIGDRVSIQYRQDLDAAIAHIKANYPEIHSDLQALNFQIIPMIGNGCGGGNTIIPIYIHRGK